MQYKDLEIFATKKAVSNVLLLPGIPNFGIEEDNNLIKFFNNLGSNFIFLDDKTDGIKIFNNTKNIINDIKNNNILQINGNLPLFLIGLSFGGGIAIKLSNNKHINHTFALSPLTQDTIGNIDWEGLLNFVNSRSKNHLGKTSKSFESFILDKVNIKKKFTKRLSIFGIDEDQEINIPEKYNAIIFKDIGIKHFGLRKTGALKKEVLNCLFDIIIKYNLNSQK